MMLSFQENEISVKIYKENYDKSWLDIMSCQDRNFNFEIIFDNTQHKGVCIRGDDALWFSLSTDLGLKVIAENDRYQSLEKSLSTVEQIVKLQEKTETIFPTIKNCSIETDSLTGTNYLLIVMQNMGNPNKIITIPNYIPVYDKQCVHGLLQRDPTFTDTIIDNLTRLKLCPEDEWYKSINLISDKIVDFHRFSIKPDRYSFPSNGYTSDELHNIYLNMVKRYTKVLDEHKMPKWKGKIYQGYHFDNGYSMEGYTSNGEIYDSYFKLPFLPLNKVKDKKVLDIGSNQGFFCFQSALHGASEVTGIEYTSEDVLAANDINKVLNLDNVRFIQGDGVEYLMNTDDRYGLLILNSVVHQLFPNFKGCEQFMEKASKVSDYVALETPLNHSKMNISVTKVHRFLSNYFKTVRLINIYDAYSTGYRANFVCCGGG